MTYDVTFQWMLWFLIIFQLLSFAVAYQWNEQIENTSFITFNRQYIQTRRNR